MLPPPRVVLGPLLYIPPVLAGIWMPRLSPVSPDAPLPATVEIAPVRSTRHTRPLPASDTYRFPAASVARPRGPAICASTADPLQGRAAAHRHLARPREGAVGLHRLLA